MPDTKPNVGVVMTMLDLYRTAHPEVPEQFATHWTRVLVDLFKDAADLHILDVVFTEEEVAGAVRDCEQVGCDLLIVMPLSYAPSGAAVKPLVETDLPLAVVSTARDATLPYDMNVDHIMANHAVHGVQDLANVLARYGRKFELVAGHPSQAAFRERLLGLVRTAAAAKVFLRGTVVQIGEAFEGMLDFNPGTEFADAFGLRVEARSPEDLADAAGRVTADRVAEVIQWAKTEFQPAPDITAEEFEASARWSVALEDLVEDLEADAVTMNFLAVAEAGAETMPFLGASNLLSEGVGYAGEGDFMTAALVTAMARIAGESTFTEMFCPDYERNEVLLSHMGECNFRMAHPDRPVRLVAKTFLYGRCARPLVPVFQLRPGAMTMACITQWPDDGFRIIACRGEVLEAPDHPNLASPYTRVRLGANLPAFLEAYSRAGGTHHLGLAYGDVTGELAALARLLGIGCVTV